jgi:hypothetical protein
MIGRLTFERGRKQEKKLNNQTNKAKFRFPANQSQLLPPFCHGNKVKPLKI